MTDQPTSLQQRRDEIIAKKAKLAELKRQRELRQKEFTASRQSIGDGLELVSPTPSRAENRHELDHIINSLIGESRPSSTGPREPGSPAGVRGSRPTSVISAGQLSVDNVGSASPPSKVATPGIAMQSLSIAPSVTVYDYPSSPKHETYMYSKGVQTESFSPSRRRSLGSGSDSDRSGSRSRTPRGVKRLSRRERERDEELRQNIRSEIEEELKSLRQGEGEGSVKPGVSQNFPARALSDEELNAVTSSEDFLGFIERSSKVIERALDQEYDILADYALGATDFENDDDGFGAAGGKKGRRIKETAQFWDERWSKKRMISDIDFSPKFPELLLSSFTKNPSAPHDPDGLIQVWNLHMHDRSEYVFHAQSDILTAKFSPFHPNLIIGGAYSGQVLLWDTRAKSAPVQKTPLTGNGHTHPVYSIDIVGTQNANNIISCSTDGVVCGWSVDMLSQPQEFLELITPAPSKTDVLAPTCIAFPPSDPTYFLAGSEEGSIYPCHRYDRAGAKAGVDTGVSYRGHGGPVMSLDFHPAKGPIDLSDLVLSSSLDWSVKLWKVRPPAATSAATGSGSSNNATSSSVRTSLGGGATAPLPTGSTVAAPLTEFVREDLVYDAKWSPVKPGVFGLVDGAGNVEVWDMNVDVEVPVAKAAPSNKRGVGSLLSRSLNKLAWEHNEGKRVAVGGLDGVVTVFEVGADLGGLENVRTDEWTGVKKFIGRLDSGSAMAANGA